MRLSKDKRTELLRLYRVTSAFSDDELDKENRTILIAAVPILLEELEEARTIVAKYGGALDRLRDSDPVMYRHVMGDA